MPSRTALPPNDLRSPVAVIALVMLLLRHHRGLDGHDHVEGARSGIHRGFTAVSFAGPGTRRSIPHEHSDRAKCLIHGLWWLTPARSEDTPPFLISSANAQTWSICAQSSSRSSRPLGRADRESQSAEMPQDDVTQRVRRGWSCHAFGRSPNPVENAKEARPSPSTRTCPARSAGPRTSAAEPPSLPPGSRRTKRWPARNGAAPGCSCCPPDQRESDPARLSPAGRDRPLGDEAWCISLLARAPAQARPARPETPVLRGCPP